MDGDDPPPPIQDPDPDDRSNASAEREIDQRSISDLTKGKFGLRPTPPTEARSGSSLKAELEEAEEALKVAMGLRPMSDKPLPSNCSVLLTTENDPGYQAMVGSADHKAYTMFEEAKAMLHHLKIVEPETKFLKELAAIKDQAEIEIEASDAKRAAPKEEVVPDSWEQRYESPEPPPKRFAKQIADLNELVDRTLEISLTDSLGQAKANLQFLIETTNIVHDKARAQARALTETTDKAQPDHRSESEAPDPDNWYNEYTGPKPVLSSNPEPDYESLGLSPKDMSRLEKLKSCRDRLTERIEYIHSITVPGNFLDDQDCQEPEPPSESELDSHEKLKAIDWIQTLIQSTAASTVMKFEMGIAHTLVRLEDDYPKLKELGEFEKTLHKIAQGTKAALRLQRVSDIAAREVCCDFGLRPHELSLIHI